MSNTDTKTKKPTLTQQLKEAQGLNVSKDATILVLQEKLREAESAGKAEVDKVYTLKNKEMRQLLITIGTPFGLIGKKMARSQFHYQEEKDKEVPELAGELAGMMGQLLEEKRIAEARYEEKNKEVSWLRGIVEGVIPGKKKKVEQTVSGKFTSIAFGKWVCTECGYEVEHVGNAPTECPRCDKHAGHQHP